MIAEDKRIRLYAVAILAFGFLIRLIGLSASVADDHSWNQVSAATVVRHFVEDGIDFFHPRWDVLERLEPGPRIEAEEAPIYHTIVATITSNPDKVPQRARLVTILFGTLAALYLFLLVKRKTDEQTALFALLFYYLAPYPIFFFRTIMSDPAMLFAMIAALYHFDKYLEEEEVGQLLLAAGFTALAGLFKPFALQIGVPIFILAAMKFRWRLFVKPALWFYAIVALAFPLAWIAWAAHIGSLGNVTDVASGKPPKLFGALSLLIDGAWYYRMQWRLFDRMMTPIVSGLMLAAIVLKDARPKTRFFWIWLTGVAVFFLMIRSGNMEHNYYQLPAAAPFAAIAAIGFVSLRSHLAEKWRKPATAVIVVGFLIVSAIYALPHYKHDRSSEIAGRLAGDVTQPGQRLLVVDPGVTRKNQVIWAAHREGWHFQSLNPEQLQEYKRLGAAAVVIVVEPQQKSRVEPLIEHLMQHGDLAVRKTGPFGKNGKSHDILIFQLGSGKSE
jgi:Dolichyl-phosphate-mannose-protein mannosyltransferase